MSRVKVKHRVNFERQSTPYTCGAKSLQLILNFFNPGKYPLGRDLEMEIYRRAKIEGYRPTTPPLLARVALEEGFAVEYLMSTPKLFEYPGEDAPMPREEFEKKLALDMKYFKEAKALGLIHRVVDLTPGLCSRYLSRGMLLLAMGDFQGVLHDFVIRGFEGVEQPGQRVKPTVFYIVDPARGQYTMYWGSLIDTVKTKYGISVLCIGRRDLPL